jgi:hypothetical protein
MRNLIVISKILPGADSIVDSLIARLSNARDLNELVAATQSGRGLLYWISYYDPWLMGDDLDLQKLELQTQPIAADLIEISLAESTWAKVNQMLSQRQQWPKQEWLVWHLWQAFRAFQSWNSNARLFFGREVLGTSLDDSEVSSAEQA